MRPTVSLRTRLSVSFAVAIVLVVVAGIVVVLLASSVASARATARTRATAVIVVADLDAAWESQQAALRGVELDGGEGFSTAYDQASARAAQLEDTLGDLAESSGTADDTLRDHLERSRASRRGWMAAIAEPRIALVRGGGAVTPEMLVAGEEAFVAAQGPLVDLREAADAGRDDARSALASRSRALVAASVASGVVALAAIVGLLLLVRRWITVPISRVTEAVRRLADGELDHQVPTPGASEIAQLGADVETMRQRLRGELARIVDSSYLAAAEDERARLAGEIHDDTLQTMAAVSIRLELAAQGVEDPDLVAQLDRCREGIAAASKRLRNLLFELHPPSLDAAGLAAALEDYADFLFRGTDTEVQVSSALDDQPAPAVQALGYRVGRELVLNVAKHARATHLAIQVTSRDGGIDLVVEDDGVGLAPVGEAAGDTSGRGLRGMVELVERAGGRTERRTGPDGGSRAAVWLPA